MTVKTALFSFVFALILFFGGAKLSRADDPLMHVHLPGLRHWTPVYMCPLTWNPNWDTSQIGNAACVLEGRALPGLGNALLAGHNYGDFAQLYNVKPGWMIHIKQAGHVSGYKIASIFTNPTRARNLIISPENRLVLFTSTASSTERLIVIAYPQ